MQVFWLLLLVRPDPGDRGRGLQHPQRAAPHASRVSAGRVAERAARLAASVAWLSDADWSREIARLAGPGARPPVSADPPTVRARWRGTASRWWRASPPGGAGTRPRPRRTHLARYFAREGIRLGPITADAFDGLRAAALARDPDELADFVELLREMFS